jgi:hypothetical protein
LQLTALRRARSGLFCVLEALLLSITVALARAARRQLNPDRWAGNLTKLLLTMAATKWWYHCPQMTYLTDVDA